MQPKSKWEFLTNFRRVFCSCLFEFCSGHQFKKACGRNTACLQAVVHSHWLNRALDSALLFSLSGGGRWVEGGTTSSALWGMEGWAVPASHESWLCSLLCLYTEQMDSHHSVYLNVTAAPRIEQKNNYSRAELTSEAKQGDLTGFSRGDPRRDLLSCHGIKTSTGALLAADWGVMGKDLVGCLMTFMSSVCLLWVTASNLTSHILLIRASERRSLSSQASHQHPFPQILSHFWVACTHTCTHRLTFSSCHWGCDTRSIGLWQEIHTVDRWVLLSLTGEKIAWMKKGGGGRMKEHRGRSWRGGRASYAC